MVMKSFRRWIETVTGTSWVLTAEALRSRKDRLAFVLLVVSSYFKNYWCFITAVVKLPTQINYDPNNTMHISKSSDIMVSERIVMNISCDVNDFVSVQLPCQEKFSFCLWLHRQHFQRYFHGL